MFYVGIGLVTVLQKNFLVIIFNILFIQTIFIVHAMN